MKTTLTRSQITVPQDRNVLRQRRAKLLRSQYSVLVEAGRTEKEGAEYACS
jgi:hypothetical protein